MYAIHCYILGGGGSESVAEGRIIEESSSRAGMLTAKSSTIILKLRRMFKSVNAAVHDPKGEKGIEVDVMLFDSYTADKHVADSPSNMLKQRASVTGISTTALLFVLELCMCGDLK